MKIFHSLEEWRCFRNAFPQVLSLGFIPTMGNLHAGHLSLVDYSQRDNDKTIVSIFVNPMQFTQKEDFIYYPRTLETDLAYLEQKKVDYCFLPSEKDLLVESPRFQIQDTYLSEIMEGRSRPGHFTGVLTIVMKFFQIIKPKQVYFGEKDYQQYLLIRDMIEDFCLDIKINPCSTLREKSGLALSSRNNRLTHDQRIKADQFAKIFHQNKSCQELLKELRSHQIEVDYIEEHFERRFIAVKIGGVRLIDNYSLTC